MSTLALLCLIIPLGCGALFSAYTLFISDAIASKIAQFIKHFPRGRYILTLAMLVCSCLGALSIDFLDLSEVIKGEGAAHRETMANITYSLGTVHNLSGAHLNVVSNAITDLFNTVKPKSEPNMNILLCLGVGFFGGLYLVFLSLDLSSEASLLREIAEHKKNEIECQKGLQRAQQETKHLHHVLHQVEAVVTAKLKRINRHLATPPRRTTDPGLIGHISDVLLPDGQIQALVECMHDFLKDSEKSTLILRVALFEKQGTKLLPIASTNGSLHEVVKLQPSDEDFFRLDATPRSAATHAFITRKPVIVSNCTLPHAQFVQLEGVNGNLKSLVVFPLNNSDNVPIGVLSADANEIDYFCDTEEFRHLLELLGRQIALRFTLENRVRDLLSRMK